MRALSCETDEDEDEAKEEEVKAGNDAENKAAKVEW